MTLRELLTYLQDHHFSLMEERRAHIERLAELITNLYEMNFLDITLYHYFMIIAFFISSYVWGRALDNKPSLIPPTFVVLFTTLMYWFYLFFILIQYHVYPFLLGWILMILV
tara:strand:- start:321 stop:656 length:336 start_codon:yes stop_codon:yes gene_type:complete